MSEVKEKNKRFWPWLKWWLATIIFGAALVKAAIAFQGAMRNMDLPTFILSLFGVALLFFATLVCLIIALGK